MFPHFFFLFFFFFFPKQLARDSGAAKVFFASAAPAVRYPNVYGIDMPVKTEFVAHERTSKEIARVLGVDWLMYQDLGDLEAAVRSLNPNIRSFDTSCFDGKYVTGDINDIYLQGLDQERNDKKQNEKNKKYRSGFAGSSAGGEQENDIQSGGGL